MFSILIASYNPVWKKLKVTIDSVLKQDYRDFEIVVTDDGSENNLFPEIEEYMKAQQFENYKLVAHEKNQGTVKNLIDGVKACSGKYVRDFGPGDAFYNEKSLGRLYQFMEDNQAEACFGLMRGYCVSEAGDITYTNFLHPFDIEAYRKQDIKRIEKNLILYRDNASGACTSYTREYYLEYLEKLVGTVVYTEDIFQLMAGIDGRTMQLYPDYLIWYEADTGVSTKKRSPFQEKLALDVDKFYAMLQEKYPENQNVKAQKRVSGLYKIRNLYVRTLIRFFVNPDAIRYLVSHWIQTKKGSYLPKNSDEGFLKEII